MKPARMIGLVLQVMSVAYALAAAQHVRGAHASVASVPHRHNADGSGSMAGDVGAGMSWRRPSHTKSDKKLFGGRRNDTMPSLGDHRRHVGLLLEAMDQESEQLQGCISVAIAPRFFLTRASCVRDQENAMRLFIEVAEKNSNSVARHALAIKTTTLHPDFSVNLAIVEVQDQKNVLHTNIQPMPIHAYAAPYYQRDDSLSLVSIDNIFNPSLALNAQAINELIRVPVQSCQYNSDPSAIHCFAPAELASREVTFAFGQGMLVHKNQGLVGLPDCDGFCSGGMFYSTIYLATYQDWIDTVTAATTQWTAQKFQPFFVPVPTEQEPTYVALYASKDGDAVCAGSLIAPRFVVTTASCVSKHSLTIARMNHGERATVLDGHEDMIPITTISIHPQFANTTKLSNDVAVIELSAPTIYAPTILASDDSLDQEIVDAVTCPNPRRSSVDSSIMCLPPVQDSEAKAQWGVSELVHNVGDGFDVETISLDSLLTDSPSGDCREKTIEQWNKDAGDGVFDVPASGSYYLLGLSTGRSDTPVSVGGGSTNQTIGRLCSVNETVGDDDDSTLVVRLATPETIEFIDTVSVDHTWLDPHHLPSSIIESKMARMKKSEAASINAESFSIEYDGGLVFQQPPKNLDLGFVVGLRFEKFGQNYCGGTLIAPSYVLTAAHCVTGDRAKFVSVGSHESKGAETEVIAVTSANIITHPLYGKRSLYSYDVAILELDSPAYPKPIVLDNSRELNPSTYLTLYGYGANSASSAVLSEVLRSVDLPYFARDKCKAKFPELDESMFCAGGELARDACTGDSGSPLIRIVDGKPRLVGVVSSGRNGCGTPGVPGVYAFVAEVQSFIDSVVAGNKWVDASKRSSGTLGLKGNGGDTAGEGAGGAGAAGAAAGAAAGSGLVDKDSEARAADSDGTVLRSYDGKKTAQPFDVINMANGAVDHQLSLVEMAADTPRGLQSALMEFLVGDFDNIVGWRPQVDEHWKAAFYSTGDLMGLMKLITTHRARPLYDRTNRFARPAWRGGRGEQPAVSSAGACASSQHKRL